MRLPDSHLASLENLLRNHDEKLVVLKASLQAATHEAGRQSLIEKEIRIHEALLALGRTQKHLDILGELAADPALARDAARDPKAFAEERGVSIPPNLALELHVVQNRVSLRVTHYCAIAPFVLTWNSNGFSVPDCSPH